MTDWLPWTGTAVRSAAFPAPTGPLGAGAPPEAVRAAAPDAPLAGRGALGTGARSAARAPPMVAGEEAPAEQPAASAQAPAASSKACAARRRDGETQARCTRAIMPIGRQHRHGGSHGNVTTWQLYWPGGATPRSPPVAGAPVPSSRKLGRVGPGERPPVAGGATPGFRGLGSVLAAVVRYELAEHAHACRGVPALVRVAGG